MKPKHILVPTDFGESAGFALRYARELAEECGATLHVLHVIPYPLETHEEEPVSELCRKREHLALDRLEGLLRNVPEERLRLMCCTGTPLVEIVDYARAHDIDLIVMGSHCRLPTPQMASASVTENIVRQSSCPVLVVQAPARELVA